MGEWPARERAYSGGSGALVGEFEHRGEELRTSKPWAERCGSPFQIGRADCERKTCGKRASFAGD
jgi:hypothetical protein